MLSIHSIHHLVHPVRQTQIYRTMVVHPIHWTLCHTIHWYIWFGSPNFVWFGPKYHRSYHVIFWSSSYLLFSPLFGCIVAYYFLIYTRTQLICQWFFDIVLFLLRLLGVNRLSRDLYLHNAVLCCSIYCTQFPHTRLLFDCMGYIRLTIYYPISFYLLFSPLNAPLAWRCGYSWQWLNK